MLESVLAAAATQRDDQTHHSLSQAAYKPHLQQEASNLQAG